VREFQYIHQLIGKKEFKSCERIQTKFDQKEKRNQSADTLAGFEITNKIQKPYKINKILKGQGHEI